MSEEREDEYFTLVFKGDIRAFKGNPLKTDTPFGVPIAVSVGDILKEADELRDEIDDRDMSSRGMEE